MKNRQASQALFQSIGVDGAEWLFVVGCDGGWAIMLDGKEVRLGTSRQASIETGVKKFLSLTRIAPGSEAACDPVVGALLDRIESGISATAKVANCVGSIGPSASKIASVYPGK